MTHPGPSEERNRDLVIIGLTGGVGAGKSTVARLFEDLGCARFDADARARAALDEPEVRGAIVARWGAGCLDGSGAVDRSALGRIVFADPAARKELEGLVHPRVRAAMEEAIGAARTGGAPAIVLDIPLLLEGGLDARCDVVVFVDAPEALRARNVVDRGWDDEERLRRERAQATIDDKRRRADVVIRNDSDLPSLRGKVASALARILQDRAGGGPAASGGT